MSSQTCDRRSILVTHSHSYVSRWRTDVDEQAIPFECISGLPKTRVNEVESIRKSSTKSCRSRSMEMTTGGIPLQT